MIIGRVVGDVVATRKHPSHEDIKLLSVQPLDRRGKGRGAPLIAVDVLDAGAGDMVLLTLDGWAAMTAVGRVPSPIDSAVIAVIDSVEWDEPEARD